MLALTRPLERAKRASNAGLTLVELIAVLAIAGVLLAVALPDVASMLRQYRLKAAASDLYVALEQTRAQAIARGARVLLVPAASDGVSWREGWLIMIDRDGDRRPGRGDEILAEHPALDGAITVTSVFTAQKAPYYVGFNGAGRTCTDTSSVAARWGSFTLSDGENARRIRLSMLGRARMCNPERDGASCGAVE
jgi:type IV fimbrial biogenesis protein FimT